VTARVAIRAYRRADFDAVTALWRFAREKSLPDFQRSKGHFFFEDCEYFRNYVLEKNRLWVALLERRRVGFIAMNVDFVDQLHVHPEYWRRGVGSALLEHARRRSPRHVWLFTLQANAGARAFYEARGFVAEKFGVSPPPESEADVEYHWRPAA
jgi:ribosomal protein S18 acetylase RimI-like enzyme